MKAGRAGLLAILVACLADAIDGQVGPPPQRSSLSGAVHSSASGNHRRHRIRHSREADYCYDAIGLVACAQLLADKTPRANVTAEPTSRSFFSKRRKHSGKQALDGEPEDLQCDAEESRQCAFSCGECSNTPLCTADAQPLLESKLHSGPATGEDTGEEGYPEEGEGGQAVSKRIALCVTGAREDGAVDAYAMRSVINCLLPSLRRDRTDLFVVASDGWRNVQAERIAVAVDRRPDPTLFEVTNVLRQMSPEVHKTWEDHDLPPTWTKKGEPNMQGHSLGRLWLQHVRMKRCLQAIETQEAARGDKYHLIVRTRMDAKWFAPLPRAPLARLLSANSSHPLVFTPSDQAWGGINDRFVMTTRPGFVAFAELFRNLIRKDAKGPFAAGWSRRTNHTDFGCVEGKCNSEKLLKYHITSLMPDASMGTLEAPFCLLNVPQPMDEDLPQDRYQPLCSVMEATGQLEGMEALRVMGVAPLCVCDPVEALELEDALLKQVRSQEEELGTHEAHDEDDEFTDAAIAAQHHRAVDSWHHLLSSVWGVGEARGDLCTWPTKDSRCSLFDARI